MKATVVLKEGRSYHWNGHVFTANPSVLTDPREIRACQSIGVLRVEIEEDGPVPGDDGGVVEGTSSSDVPTKPIVPKVAAPNKPKPGPKPGQKPAQAPKPQTP